MILYLRSGFLKLYACTVPSLLWWKIIILAVFRTLFYVLIKALLEYWFSEFYLLTRTRKFRSCGFWTSKSFTLCLAEFDWHLRKAKAVLSQMIFRILPLASLDWSSRSSLKLSYHQLAHILSYLRQSLILRTVLDFSALRIIGSSILLCTCLLAEMNCTVLRNDFTH